MAHANETEIKAVLRTLIKSSPHVTASAVARLSGMNIVSVMPYYVEEERVSAMSAVMLLLGERMTGAMRNGQLNQVYVRGDTGHIVLRSIGEDAVLTVTATDEAPLGLLFLEMELAVERLQKLV
jgi:hypothetical protein